MSRVFWSTIMIWIARMPKPADREDGADDERDDRVLHARRCARKLALVSCQLSAS